MDLLGSKPRGKKSPFNAMWLIAFALTGMLAYSGISSFGGKEIIPWRDDFAAAQAEAKRTGKPMFVYFTADWCAPCQSMKRTTWADADVERVLQAYVPTRVDMDRNMEIARQFQVDTLPQYFVMDNEGNIKKHNSEGGLPSNDLLAWLATP